MKNIIKNKIVLSLGAALLLASCKAPMATKVQDRVKDTLPTTFGGDQNNTGVENNSGITPWKQFFTDPNLVSLIEEALKNNQELMITLQQIEIAKSDVLYKNGKLKPTVSAGVGAGVEKVGRYTSTGAGDASTDITDGK
ncbi:MAG: TolC family protein, partial [Soonwooa sp.]